SSRLAMRRSLTTETGRAACTRGLGRATTGSSTYARGRSRCTGRRSPTRPRSSGTATPAARTCCRRGRAARWRCRGRWWPRGPDGAVMRGWAGLSLLQVSSVIPWPQLLLQLPVYPHLDSIDRFLVHGHGEPVRNHITSRAEPPETDIADQPASA